VSFCALGPRSASSGAYQSLSRPARWSWAAHSEFKTLDEPVRQRSDCCSSGTSSCQSEASAGAGRRAGAVGGPVVGRPRCPRTLEHRLLVDEGDDLAASAAGTSEDVLAEDAQQQLVPRNARIEGPGSLAAATSKKPTTAPTAAARRTTARSGSGRCRRRASCSTHCDTPQRRS